MQINRSAFTHWRALPLVRVLPKPLRDLKYKKAARLDWLLAEESGSFCVGIVDKRGYGNHVVAVLTDGHGRRVILDNEEKCALPLGIASFNWFCEPG